MFKNQVKITLNKLILPVLAKKPVLNQKKLKSFKLAIKLIRLPAFLSLLIICYFYFYFIIITHNLLLLIKYQKNKTFIHQPKTPICFSFFPHLTTLIYTSISFYIFYFSALFIQPLYAQTPKPAVYHFHFVDLNATISSQPNLPSYNPSYAYTKAVLPFNFTVSNISINLDPVHNPISSQILTVSTGNAHGYTISLLANHLLKLKNSNSYIPNTGCDHFCDLQSAGLWTDPNKPGFGYRTDFFKKDFYKPFPIADHFNSPQIIMSSNSMADYDTATLTYKLILNPNQPPGNYQNQITFYAVPAY